MLRVYSVLDPVIKTNAQNIIFIGILISFTKIGIKMPKNLIGKRKSPSS